MTPLSREGILAATAARVVEVEVPEWGGSVYVGEMTGAERDTYEMLMLEQQRTQRYNVRGLVAALTLSDEAGLRLFNADDAGRLGALEARALGRVFDAASALNGLTDAAREDIAGN